jgi:hypothetical protein
MLEALGPGTRLGYCTNVHAGADLDATLANLERHAVRVRELLGVNELGIGLWLSALACEQALARLDEVRGKLRTWGLRVFTLNGFPYDDFHGAVVKHRVYEPCWGDPRRLRYTLQLIEALHALLPEGEEGSISTLPLGWPGGVTGPVDLRLASDALRAVAARLADLERTTGRIVHVDIEPEPGCMLERGDGAARFFEEWLLRGDHGCAVRRHLRVCHDVCHSAVMFEEQAAAFAAYERAGIAVGKVQVSSALAARGKAAAELERFVEPRYLHQTSVRVGADVRRFDDLPRALEECTPADGDEWRVHFHVPVYMGSIGALGTTQGEIRPAIALALKHGVRHFEVETYAWGVLPEGMRPAELAAGIAEEMRWVAGCAGGVA